MRQGRRDVLLTTLIDLLVQFVFVFVIILIVRETGTGPKSGVAEGGFDLRKPWQMLVEAFDREHQPPIDAAQAVIDEHRQQQQRIAALEKELQTERVRAAAEGRAPGAPRCKSAGRVLVPFVFNIRPDGSIEASQRDGWPAAESWLTEDGEVLALQSLTFANRLYSAEFERSFGSVAMRVRRHRDCIFVVDYDLAPGMDAETADASREFLGRFFYPRRARLAR